MKRMKKVYISLPISGRPIEEAKANAERVKEMLEELGYEAVSPFDVVPEVPKGMTPSQAYAYCMGRDIEALMQCDGIYLCNGYQQSKGCQLELEAARLYGIEIAHRESK